MTDDIFPRDFFLLAACCYQTCLNFLISLASLCNDKMQLQECAMQTNVLFTSFRPYRAQPETKKAETLGFISPNSEPDSRVENKILWEISQLYDLVNSSQRRITICELRLQVGITHPCYVYRAVLRIFPGLCNENICTFIVSGVRSNIRPLVNTRTHLLEEILKVANYYYTVPALPFAWGFIWW